VHSVTLSSAASTAALTVGLAAYAGLILAGIAVAIYDARRHRRNRAIAAAVMVGVLTLGGLVMAIVSSVA
jgi:ABC-type enterochelin transport system permease subunit